MQVCNGLFRLITQVGGSNPSRATNRIKLLACLQGPLRWAFLFCVEVCDEVGVVTVSGLSASDHWVCVEFLESISMRPAIPPLQNDNNDVRRCAI